MPTLLFHSNAPITLTGYGVQTALFASRIRDLGYGVSLNCPMSLTTAPITWDGMVMYGSAGDGLGNDLLPARSASFDYTLTLCDLFGLFPCSEQLKGRRMIHWMPVDTEPMGERDIATLRNTQGIPVAMSKHGLKQIRREGFDPLYVPHGVDTAVFKPDTEAGRTFRLAHDISPDTYVIGIAAVNKPDSRKGLDQQMQAFARFHARHPDSVLYMHTVANGSWQLEKIALNLGIHNAVKFPDTYAYLSQGITQDGVAQWYNSLNLLSACSEGEGFGLPILEAQSCGTPVVTTDASAMTELCSSGWLVPGQRHWVGGHESWWVTPDVDAITARYEEAWNARDDSQFTGRARALALQYDADLVTATHWKPVMEQIEARYAAR